MLTKVYLAHHYQDREYGTFIEEMLTLLGIDVINPFTGSEQSYYESLINNGAPFSHSNCRDIVRKDLNLIWQSDAVVAILCGSIGTSMEVMYASYSLHKNVFALDRDNQFSNHPWVRSFTHLYTTPEDLIISISEFLDEYRTTKTRKYTKSNIHSTGEYRKQESDRQSQVTRRHEVLQHYGGICACCGFDDLYKTIRGTSYLTIDHINQESPIRDKKQRKSLWFYLRQAGYPEGFRVLCLPCNVAMEYGADKCEMHG